MPDAEIAGEAPEASDGGAPAEERAPIVADEVLLAAVDLARGALLEVTPAQSVGSVLGHVADADHVLSLHFAADLPGYPGWHWSVTLARVEDGEPTVLESELLPGERALLAPEWVPWSERLAEYRATQAAAAAESEAADEESDVEDGADGDEGSDRDEADYDVEDEDEDEDEDAADADDFGDEDAGDDVFDGIDIDALDGSEADDDDSEDAADDEEDADVEGGVDDGDPDDGDPDGGADDRDRPDDSD
ncbi:hypothetical protein GCM10017608_35920 [Agromyces luteolus]|uniref:DUF3027 domain-containing protein n=1 Tax=Agromyces luteolus TaxID=88373 RepID=A0A7C9MHH7_9MICO|nr:DUF3027 domain-containing protein [Agromyces luteolus]MUN07198.1 DUF3027 domain-containing protein [Agromyces luteolus]GLK29654.1 hypothetical protein GCM10017608_35920 [Agromyces luteolus]